MKEHDKITLDIGSKIRFFRELKGISQESLASHLGISQQAFQKIESGATRLDIQRADIIAQELGLQLDALLSFNPANYWYHCSQSGNNHSITNNQADLSSELIKSYEDQITSLKEEITFLRSLVKQQM